MWALEVALAVLLLATSCAVAVSLWRLQNGLDRVATRTAQLDVIAAENARLAKSARDVARAVDTTTAAVEIGTNLVRASHQAIAAIPFGVLESIPATRATSKIVRGIHDGTSAGVYKAISGVNKAIGNAVRDAMNARTGAEITGPAPIEPVRIEVERLDPAPELVVVADVDAIEPEVPVLALEPAVETEIPLVDATDPVVEDTETDESAAPVEEDPK